MSMTLAAALGSAAGALALVGILIFVVRYCILRRSTSRTSESNSSEPSMQAGQSVELVQESTSYLPGVQGSSRRFGLEELNLATKNFNDINLIGHGLFGEVYKGLLQDGMIVAIKRRPAAPSQDFIEEVRYLSSIRHKNLVSLLGYCQESDLQMLIYEYIPNGSVSAHLYGASQASTKRLEEFKNRLSIAHGVATGNVLVDEDFIPKVADAGLRILLYRVDGVGSSQITLDDPFLDPEVREFGRFSVKSDVYSFGVFLMELVSGKEARSEQSIRKWVQKCQDVSDITSLVDQRMSSSFTSEGIREFVQLIVWCLNPIGERRPLSSYLVSELDRIREKEMNLTTIRGEGTTTVLLGSQLFQ
ncbi:probable serine/threonine-protein kinase PBL21 isoform X3 [Dendrobium catenatum]|uniref:probable serine/threonine-protein kinase PBL21 isoform X3 n=1 Tax=Dendrobium catenatum TaxID=906689 RepID=UPI0009F3F617|nr:probable serine/threonine-protein kinase PBL21 isoform X3 [Dendrobium catenatum]